MKKLLYISLILCLYCSIVQGQQTSNYVNNWYFGIGSAVTFNSGFPQNQFSAIEANEAMSTVSDGFGNVIFYHAADSVWDASHQVMPNGRGLNGDFSSSCGAVSCRMPGRCDQYYLFHLSSHGPGWGLAYSVVDKSLAGNGTLASPLGDVVPGQKNIMHFSSDNLAEKLLIVQKGNTEDYWVICRSIVNDVFYAFEVSASGISALPVVSTISATPFPGLVGSPLLGWLAVNKQRTIIAEANGVLPDTKIFEFDHQTGVLSNEEVIMSGLVFPNDITYGLAFSPSGNALYVGWSSCCPQVKLFSSFDMTVGVGAVASTRRDFDRSAQLPVANDVSRAILKAPDGNIYFAWGGGTVGNNQLGRIDNVENPAAPIFTINAFTVNGSSELGLPNLAYYYHPENFPDTIAGNDRLICENTSALIGMASYDSIEAAYFWEPASMVLEPNGKTTTTLNLAADQLFVLHAVDPCGDTIKTDTVQVFVDNCLLNLDLVRFEGLASYTQKHRLNWQFNQKMLLKSIRLEQSKDGIQFETVAEKSFVYSDSWQFETVSGPENGAYYRLSWASISSDLSYSPVIYIEGVSQEQILTLFPNPNAGLFSIISSEEAQAFEILGLYNALGQSFDAQILHVEGNRWDLDASGLGSGQYVLKLEYAGTVRYLQFLKY